MCTYNDVEMTCHKRRAVERLTQCNFVVKHNKAFSRCVCIETDIHIADDLNRQIQSKSIEVFLKYRPFQMDYSISRSKNSSEQNRTEQHFIYHPGIYIYNMGNRR